MSKPSSNRIKKRIEQAAEAVLERNGNVGPLELFQELGWLQPVHLESWRKGIEPYRVLEQWIQVGPGKLQQALQCFADWSQRRGLQAIEADYSRRRPGGTELLQVSADGNPEREKFYRIHYAPATLSAKKSARLAAKLTKAPDIVVFEKLGAEAQCSECETELSRGSFLCMEKEQPLCLACADLDHLVFLPSGDTALTRRARKHSSLSAVVVRFSRARKRYERQGLLVTPEGLDKAEAECAVDVSERAAARARAAVVRQREDSELVDAMAGRISQLYPACPPDEARSIADHTARRGSGRVGRSAAGRQLDPAAIRLAVLAHIRHNHTDYDDLLMRGTDRLAARVLVRDEMESVRAKWAGT